MAQTFDPYGNLYTRDGDQLGTFGFAGEQSDANGLIYLRVRFYNPSTGRFLNMDPSRLEMNPYQYAAGNPVMYTDPSGLTVGPWIPTCGWPIPEDICDFLTTNPTIVATTGSGTIVTPQQLAPVLILLGTTLLADELVEVGQELAEGCSDLAQAVGQWLADQRSVPHQPTDPETDPIPLPIPAPTPPVDEDEDDSEKTIVILGSGVDEKSVGQIVSVLRRFAPEGYKVIAIENVDGSKLLNELAIQGRIPEFAPSFEAIEGNYPMPNIQADIIVQFFPTPQFIDTTKSAINSMLKPSGEAWVVSENEQALIKLREGVNNMTNVGDIRSLSAIEMMNGNNPFGLTDWDSFRADETIFDLHIRR